MWKKLIFTSTEPPARWPKVRPNRFGQNRPKVRPNRSVRSFTTSNQKNYVNWNILHFIVMNVRITLDDYSSATNFTYFIPKKGQKIGKIGSTNFSNPNFTYFFSVFFRRTGKRHRKPVGPLFHHGIPITEPGSRINWCAGRFAPSIGNFGKSLIGRSWIFWSRNDLQLRKGFETSDVL